MRCERRVDLRRARDAVEQPVGHVLRGDAQRRAVLHQADIVDVGHLRAADALVDPAHDIAEDALGIVVELAARLPPADQLRPVASGTVSSGVERRHRLGRDLLPAARTRRPR